MMELEKSSFCNYQFNSLTRPKIIIPINHWVKGVKCCNLGVKVSVQLIFKGFTQNKKINISVCVFLCECVRDREREQSKAGKTLTTGESE